MCVCCWLTAFGIENAYRERPLVVVAKNRNADRRKHRGTQLKINPFDVFSTEMAEFPVRTDTEAVAVDRRDAPSE